VIVRTIAITGGRDVHPSTASLRSFASLVQATRAALVVHGDCRTGVDQVVAEYLVRTTDVAVEGWPADWKRYRRWAGPRRNKLMLEQDRREWGGENRETLVDLLVAWPGGVGTADCTESAHRLGILVLPVDRIAADVLRGDKWTHQQVIDRLDGLRKRQVGVFAC